jgi:phosphomannomutase/phosphoglucomutase
LISPNIFRLYDIRGVVDRDLSEEAAYKIARALAAQAAQRGWNKVLLGRDNRLSSPRLRDITVKALLDSGWRFSLPTGRSMKPPLL